MADNDSPLIQALPPNSDYLTYLTIVEYNLTSQNLPILHHVLQDETLTTNIGWDLVHLLVPHLPESEPCLKDIAALGNPREVILKVTESLRLIEYESFESDDESGDFDSKDARQKADSSPFPAKTAAVDDSKSKPTTSQMVELPPPLPLSVNQFISLLSMLSVLHGRIKTKFPSRFLSTTLQAVLSSFSKSAAHREEMVLAIVKLIKSVRGISRPTLPSRKSSSMLLSDASGGVPPVATDPEEKTGVQPDAEDAAIQLKLLQSFVTHVVEEYLLNLADTDDVPGMAWSTRLMEKLHSDRTVPGAKSMTSRFSDEQKLHRRIDTVGQLVILAKDLNLSDQSLLATAVAEEAVLAVNHDEDEPPATANDIPLSRIGSILLYAARQASYTLYVSSKQSDAPPLEIFPNHQELLRHCLSSPAHGTGTLGTEPEALIDAILALGILFVEQNNVGEPASDEQFNEYLQVTALLSSTCPSANLRGHAHYLTSTILRCQPDEKVRLDFIRDTLEHCPFENLKVSAVGWIKGETIEANPPTPMAEHNHPQAELGTPTSVFATPFALDSVAPYVFPSIQADLLKGDVHESWAVFQSNLSFYLASLNFLYLLICAQHLHDALAIKSLWTNSDMAGSFLQPLREAVGWFRKEAADGGQLAQEKSDATMAELGLMDETIARVTKAAVHLKMMCE
ncbi:Hypothetical protein R9X50_00507100 [Acrodontium crateriforme]|uniref:DUF1760-domain-containing protein n=1 Tax=Acrodontium crateriforme TaxID=150365 RepID=A0AAQ3M8Z3_9PEZI|nr:Hypothetical protein R9X50_00507100 [Acrodontium crateriforme]